MTPRRKAWLAYSAVALAAAAALYARIHVIPPGNPYGARGGKRFANYVAAAPLPCNHRIGRRDVVPPPGIPSSLSLQLPDLAGFAGGYLRQAVYRGQPISADMLRPRPAVKLVPGGHLVRASLANQTDALDWLDAGDAVVIRFGDQTAPAEAVFVSCAADADPKTCAVALVVPTTSRLPDDSATWRISPIPGHFGWSQCDPN